MDPPLFGRSNSLIKLNPAAYTRPKGRTERGGSIYGGAKTPATPCARIVVRRGPAGPRFYLYSRSLWPDGDIPKNHVTHLFWARDAAHYEFLFLAGGLHLNIAYADERVEDAGYVGRDVQIGSAHVCTTVP